MNSNEEKLCQGKDVFERMNFLYQASRFVAGKSEVAASHYGNVMMSCAKKAVLRVEPEVKRTICKSCQSPLIPGETARIRIKSKPVKAVQWTCLVCKTTRKIPSKKPHNLWIDDPSSLVQVYDYTPKNLNPGLPEFHTIPNESSSAKCIKEGSQINSSN
ncbi:ribonuclease P protein subunit rpr2 [Venturia canescens]|uniref:ribonuclease P protein subunit rpr2 n=1 Tax=Venturia canescens TaxID=32260 RepID=UPI001C9C8E84|nr:ribonuclease P protein subunit rpr2 [Venturia canescens]XP_043266820.1 ribonuclease P protein subunit rpr2 [Venturia canescens]XP_043266829.1 ribonuclease P protein subunit rpr2 [Venturia canescens]XP_043266839.1 ribonuclease P protein subunit rpr2 [Venturia canescens]